MVKYTQNYVKHAHHREYSSEKCVYVLNECKQLEGDPKDIGLGLDRSLINLLLLSVCLMFIENYSLLLT